LPSPFSPTKHFTSAREPAFGNRRPWPGDPRGKISYAHRAKRLLSKFLIPSLLPYLMFRFVSFLFSPLHNDSSRSPFSLKHPTTSTRAFHRFASNAPMIGAAFQEQWRRVGIQLELRRLSLPRCSPDVAKEISDHLPALGWRNTDPDFFEYAFRRSAFAGRRQSRALSQRRIDALTDQIRVEMN